MAQGQNRALARALFDDLWPRRQVFWQTIDKETTYGLCVRAKT
jgi:hypothetical protein